MTRIKTTSPIEIAFRAGWNARRSAHADVAGGLETAFGMFQRGFDFGNEELGECLTLPQHTPEGADDYDPTRLVIRRIRFSTTQGKVELTYDGNRLERYSDRIVIKGSTWSGHPDAYWHSVARHRLEAERGRRKR